MSDAEKRKLEATIDRMARLIFSLSSAAQCTRLEMLDLGAALDQAKRRRRTSAQEIADSAIARARQRGI